MLYPSIDALQRTIPSKYTIVTVAAKRARQIQDGKAPKVAEPKSYDNHRERKKQRMKCDPSRLRLGSHCL